MSRRWGRRLRMSPLAKSALFLAVGCLVFHPRTRYSPGLSE